MNLRRPLISFLLPFAPAAAGLAQTGGAADPQHANDAAAAAAVATGQAAEIHAPDFLEHLVDSILEAFNVSSSGNTVTHYAIAALFLVGAVLLRRVVTGIVFNYLKKLAARTETTLDDKLFPVLEAPTATFVMITGIFAALKVLKLAPQTDLAIGYGSTVAFSLVLFWGLLRAFNAVLDHAHEIALAKQMGIAAFMPWIKKTLVTVFFCLGALLIIQSLGYNVSTILQGLGIGGLAFALAAQDTIANLFGSIVVATDQPFKIGETVTVGAHTGMVEDIGLRSTKIRKVDKSLVVIPNRTVANEAVINLSRFTQRRVEQVLGLTYDAKAGQMEAVVEDIRLLLREEPAVDPSATHVYFRDFSASSLDIWMVYVITDPDFARHMAVRQRINFTVMRAVEARGLSFAFPTQTVHVASLPAGAKV